MRLKALAEIYTMHSFAQICNLIFCQAFAKNFAKFCKILQNSAKLAKFRKFSIFGNFEFSNLFSQISVKKRQTSLFYGICREIRTKIHKKFAEKYAEFDVENEKNRKINSIIQSQKMLTIFG